MPPESYATAVDAREGALAKYLEAQRIEEENPDLSGQAGRQYDQALAEAKRLHARFIALVPPDDRARIASEQAAANMSVDQAIEHFMGGGGRMEFPFAGGASTMSAALGPSWADSILPVMDRRGMSAGLIDPSGGATVAVPIRAGVIADPRRARFVRELVPEEQAGAGIFSYLKQTVRTFNAAAVAKLAKKPTSLFTLKKVEDRTRTIAHITEPIARQDLADGTALRQFIDDELRLGLYLELDREMVEAAGAGEELTGFLNAGIGAIAFEDNFLTTTRRAVTALQKLEIVPTAWVINPDDWEIAELEAIQTFAANPGINTTATLADERLWSRPVLVSNAVPVGTALLGDFAGGAVLYATGQVAVDWSENVYDPTFNGDEGATDFQRNGIRFRAEGRFGLAVTRPAAFVAVELTAGS